MLKIVFLLKKKKNWKNIEILKKHPEKDIKDIFKSISNRPNSLS